MEDCIDVLKCILDLDKYDIRFMVDHSCGHDRQRDDGLSVLHMNKEYGGKQRYMHESQVTKEMLGPHKPLLPLHVIQKMTFTSADDGPFYMDPIEK